MLTTSPTHLKRLLLRTDPEAWNLFVKLYYDLIGQFALAAGANPADVPDITQEVLAWFYTHIPEFKLARKGAFRRWLRQVTKNFTKKHRNRNATQPLNTFSPDHFDMLAEEDPLDELNDQEDRKNLIRRAIAHIKGDFSEIAWEIFHRSHFLNQTAAQISQELNVSKNVVYIKTCRIQARLRNIIEKFIDDF